MTDATMLLSILSFFIKPNAFGKFLMNFSLNNAQVNMVLYYNVDCID